MSTPVKLLATSFSYVAEDDIVNSNNEVIAEAGTRVILVPLTTTRGVMHGNTSLEDLWDTLSKTSHTHNVATASSAGFMSAEDKAKLDSIDIDALMAAFSNSLSTVEEESTE